MLDGVYIKRTLEVRIPIDLNIDMMPIIEKGRVADVRVIYRWVPFICGVWKGSVCWGLGLGLGGCSGFPGRLRALI